MTWLWIILAFIAGMVFQYYFGMWMLKRAFGDSGYRRSVLRNIRAETLSNLSDDVYDEVLRRREILE